MQQPIPPALITLKPSFAAPDRFRSCRLDRPLSLFSLLVQVVELSGWID
jgi:hypothetical protein